MNCDGTDHIFTWPKDTRTSAGWTTFVKTRRLDFQGPCSTSVLCFRHFQDEDFDNLHRYKTQTSTKRLRLKKGVIPTLHVEKGQMVDTPRKQMKDDTLTDRERRSIIRDILSPDASPSPREVTVNLPLQQSSSKAKTRITSAASSVPSTSTPMEVLTDSETDSSSHKSSADISADWMPDCDDDIDFGSSQHDNVEIYRTARKGWYDEPKIVVEEDRLLGLLKVCSGCTNNDCNVELVSCRGAYVKYTIACSQCRYQTEWANSTVVSGKPLLNVFFAFIILCSGSLPTKFLRALQQLNIHCPSFATFKTYQRDYLHGIMRAVYEQSMTEVAGYLGDRPLSVNGDGRFDSPGHSALYGTYTLMDSESSLIISTSVVKSTETTSSPAMELEGLKRCRSHSEDVGYTIDTLTTDRHTSIAAYMRKEWSEVKHQFDCWHIAKGLRKKLKDVASRRQSYRVLQLWIPAIIDHLYYVVSHSEGDLRVEWWRSVVNHCCNIHTHDTPLFPSCKHGDLTQMRANDEGGKEYRVWIDRYNPVVKEMVDILLNRRILDAIRMTGMNATSELESFHAAINRNAPKMVGFSYSGMLTRTQLTVLHHNENCQRSVRVKADGRLQQHIARSKKSGLEPRVVYKRENPTYYYMERLFHELERHLRENTKPNLRDQEPKTLSSTGPAVEPKPHGSRDLGKKELFF